MRHNNIISSIATLFDGAANEMLRAFTQVCERVQPQFAGRLDISARFARGYCSRRAGTADKSLLPALSTDWTRPQLSDNGLKSLLKNGNLDWVPTTGRGNVRPDATGVLRGHHG